MMLWTSHILGMRKKKIFLLCLGKMSLTSLSYDECSVRQATADVRNVYANVANPIQNYRPFPGTQGQGVLVDRLGNAQSQVDLESMMRNQAFVSSSCPAYRIEADKCFAPHMVDKPLQCASGDLVPQVNVLRRSCDPLSGKYVDRFQPLFQPYLGQAQGYAPAQFGVDTKAELKSQLERSRAAYM